MQRKAVFFFPLTDYTLDKSESVNNNLSEVAFQSQILQTES